MADEQTSGKVSRVPLILGVALLVCAVFWAWVESEKVQRRRLAGSALGILIYDSDRRFGHCLGGPRSLVPDPLRAYLPRELFGVAEALTCCRETLNDEGLASIDVFPSLRWVDLGYSDVTDSGLKHLDGLAHLEGVSLRGTHVTDAGMTQVGQWKNLRELDVSDTFLSDAGLMRLTGLQNLKTLRVGRTWVTREGIERFQAECPDCLVGSDWRDLP